MARRDVYYLISPLFTSTTRAWLSFYSLLKDRILGLAAIKRKQHSTFPPPNQPTKKDEASRRFYDDAHDDDACFSTTHTPPHNLVYCPVSFVSMYVRTW